MSFDVQFSIPFRCIGIPKVMMILPILIVKFHKGYGLIRVFSIDTQEGDIEYWATNDLEMDTLMRSKYAQWSWAIEEYHRGIKQFVGVERAQVRSARGQRNHIGLALRAFLRLAHYCYQNKVSWFEAKLSIVRDAVRDYLAEPLYTLQSSV